MKELLATTTEEGLTASLVGWYIQIFIPIPLNAIKENYKYRNSRDTTRDSQEKQCSRWKIWHPKNCPRYIRISLSSTNPVIHASGLNFHTITRVRFQ
jgi:hypothetical protein